jgi:hypothetical protein
MIRILVSLAIAVVATWLFSQVLPWPLALGVAAVFFAIEVAGSERGGSIRAAMRIDAVLLAWPIASAAFDLAGVSERGVRIALAAAVAAALAGVASGRSSGQDDTRMRVLIASSLIVGYALLRALTRSSIDVYALTAGAGAACLQLAVVAGGGVVLPDRHRLVVWAVSGACATITLGSGIGWGLRAVGLLH